MPQNATRRGNSDGLSPHQIAVLESLLTGATVTKAAATVGVDRTTVHRWIRSDPVFLASLNEGKRELWESIGRQMLYVARAAADTVLEAIHDGDARTSLEVLKGIGALSGHTPRYGPDDPVEVEALMNTSAERARLRIADQVLLLAEQNRDQEFRSLTCTI